MDLLHSKTTQPSTAVSGTLSTDRFQPKPVSSASQASKKSLIDEYSRSSTSAESLKEDDKRKQTKRSLKNMEVFKHPMCLISTESVENANGEEIKINFKEEQEVLKQINKINLPMVIVAVVGPYNTGKSYLMNQLAETTDLKGFATALNDENRYGSKTKGIWVWCKMHPNMPDTVLMLLDTEGHGYSVKGDTSHYINIFTLATLLCNCLVYNMKGEFAAYRLEFVTEMAKNIRFRGEISEDNQTLSLILPEFNMCLRDCSLQHGWKTVSPNEYLEESLDEGMLSEERITKPQGIRKYFQKRMCFAIPEQERKDDIENLETLKFSDTSDKVKGAISSFVSHIYSIPPKQLLARKPFNGRMFVTLVESYVTAIKNGGVLDVDYAFEEVTKNENVTIEKEAVDMFVNEIKEKEIMFVTTDNLWRIYTHAQRAALDFFRRNAVFDTNGRYEKQAQEKMDKVWNIIVEKEEQKRNERYRYRNEQDERKRQLETEREKARRDAEIYLKQEKERQDDQRRNKENIDKLLKEHQTAQLEALNKQTKLLYNHLEIERRKYELLLEEKMKLVKEESQREIERYRKELEETKKQLETEREKAQREMEIYRKKDEDIQDEQKRNNRNMIKLLKDHHFSYMEALDKQKQMLENHCNKLDKRFHEQLEIERKIFTDLIHEKDAVQKDNERYRKEDNKRMKQLETEADLAERKAEK